MTHRQDAGRPRSTRKPQILTPNGNLRPSHPSSIRGRITSFAVGSVTVAVGATAMLAYHAVVGAVEQNEQLELETRASYLMTETQTIVSSQRDPVAQHDELTGMINQFLVDNPEYEVAVSPMEHVPFMGDAIPVDRMARNDQIPDSSSGTYGGEWVAVQRDNQGTTVALARDAGTFLDLKNRLQATLIGIAGVGTMLAALTGALIAQATVRPLNKLRRAVDNLTASDELEPIEITGDDEYGRLTGSLNQMMASLKDSRVRQSQLVADAGHELRTPLTSMRTNIELLMMLHRSGQVATMTDEDLSDIERDVMAQMEEMSTLIGDLVDLAREDVPEKEFEPTRLDEVMAEALDRVQRRRPDVEFRVHLDQWILDADSAALSRAPVNLLDNAAKWSPPGGVVRVSLRAARRTAVLVIDDSGPGIPPDEREKVFERFYRAPESRAMPGSGLGLAIAKQVLERHGASIDIEESDDGGARIRVIFPGRPVSEARP